jgi:hypothetical protein
LNTNSFVPGCPGSGVPGVPGLLGVEARVAVNVGVEPSIAAGGGSVGRLTAVNPGPGLSLDTEDSGDWLLLNSERGAIGGEAAASSSAFAAASMLSTPGVAGE